MSASYRIASRGRDRRQRSLSAEEKLPMWLTNYY